MPVQRTQASASVLGALKGAINAAAAKHAEDPTEWGNQRVPAGIQNGVARLVECKFDLYKTGPNQGKPYFRAAGVIVEPEFITTSDGRTIPVAGLQTSIMEAVCETKTQAGKVTSVEDHVASIQNELRKLGASAESLASVDGLEETAAALKEVQPFFRFSTSVRKAMQPGGGDGVWENWYGIKGLESYAPPDGEGGVEDETASQPAAKPAPSKPAAAKPAAKPPTKAPAKAPEPEPEPEPEFNEVDNEQLIESDDFEALGTSADGDDQEARDRLTTLALEAGWEQDQIDNGVESWTELANMLAAGSKPAEPEAEAAEEKEWEPTVGDVYRFQPIDPKTKKPAMNPKTKKPLKIECEVKAVDKKAKTVDLVNLDDNKTKYSKVKWGDLEGD